LAAAQDYRDELMTGLQKAIGHDDNWLDWLDGQPPANAGTAEAAAQRLAGENESTVQGVQQVTRDGYPGFQVDVQTNYTVGKSIIPGTESKHAKARATAVIEPRCTFAPDADPKKPVELICGDQTVNIDPGDFNRDDLPDASVLFSVHLAE